MLPVLKHRHDDAADAVSAAPDATRDAMGDGAGPGRYFDQAVFDLHFVLLAAHARRLATDEVLPFTVDLEGRVTLKPEVAAPTADEPPAA